MMTDWLPDFPIMWLNFKLFCGPDLCIFRFLLKCFHLFNITSSEFIFDGINIWNISLSCPILVLPLSLYQKGRKRLRDKFTQLNSLDQSVCTINLISLWVFKLSITYIFLIFPLQRSSGWYLLQQLEKQLESSVHELFGTCGAMHDLFTESWFTIVVFQWDPKSLHSWSLLFVGASRRLLGSTGIFNDAVTVKLQSGISSRLNLEVHASATKSSSKGEYCDDDDWSVLFNLDCLRMNIEEYTGKPVAGTLNKVNSKRLLLVRLMWNVCVLPLYYRHVIIHEQPTMYS